MRVGPAKGLFVLDRDDRRPRLFIGTGTGLAPLLAMLEDLGSRADDCANVLIHGVAYQDEAVYRHSDRRLDPHRPEAGLPAQPSRGRTIRATRAGPGSPAVPMRSWPASSRRWPDMRGGVAYMCGNPDMIESCTAVLAAGGIATADIRAERFHAPPPAGPRKAS